MKFRLPFLYPFLWKQKPATNLVPQSSASTPTPYPSKVAQRPRRDLSTTPFGSSADIHLIPPPIAHVRSSASYAPSHPRPSRLHTAQPPIRTLPLSSHKIPSERAGFRTSVKRRRPDTLPQRYGVANEPPPQFADQRLPPPTQPAKPPPRKLLPEPEESNTPKPSSAVEAILLEADGRGPPDGRSSDTTIMGNNEAPHAGTAPMGGIAGTNITSGVIPLAAPEVKSTPTAQNQSALGLILGMGPVSQGLDEQKPPHLQPPPYVHHFDTYTLVRDLEKGGFSEQQAVTTMKAVRGILADNIELARAGIMNKSDAEMATYLFRAACHELRTEIRSNRHSTSERMRGERTAVQHEVDVLSQRITADIQTLKDNLKLTFDDRRQSLRNNSRDVENRIQELNYRITSSLTSEMRSEVEAMRFVLVRRTAITLLFLVMLGLLALKTSSARTKRMEELEKKAKEAAVGSQDFRADIATAGVSGIVAAGLASGDDMNPELITLG